MVWFFLCVVEITGPIMLETYRVIADYSKTSKYELNLKAGDLVDIVEKSSNGEERMEICPIYKVQQKNSINICNM